MAAKRSGGIDNLCQVIDNHADLIDESVETVSIPENGTLRLTKTDGSTVDVDIPYFSDFIIDGIDLSLQANPNANRLDYTTGDYQINGVVYTLTPAGTIVLTAGDATNPRLDIVYLDTSGNINYLAGTPAVSPVPPAAPANTLIIAYVNVDVNADGTGGYTIQPVSKQNFNIQAGDTNGQTLVWNNATDTWENKNDVLVDGDITIEPQTANSLINLNSGITYNIRSVSGATTLNRTDNIVLVDATSNYTITLPANESGLNITFVVITSLPSISGTVTVADASASSIDAIGNSGSVSLDDLNTENSYRTILSLVSDGSSWYTKNLVKDTNTTSFSIAPPGLTRFYSNGLSTIILGASSTADYSLDLETEDTNFPTGAEILAVKTGGSFDIILDTGTTPAVSIDGSTTDVTVSATYTPTRIIKIAANTWVTSA